MRVKFYELSRRVTNSHFFSFFSIRANRIALYHHMWKKNSILSICEYYSFETRFMFVVENRLVPDACSIGSRKFLRERKSASPLTRRYFCLPIGNETASELAVQYRGEAWRGACLPTLEHLERSEYGRPPFLVQR